MTLCVLFEKRTFSEGFSVLGGFLGASISGVWALFGVFGFPWGPPRDLLGSVGTLLGSSWALFGPFVPSSKNVHFPVFFR